LENPASTSSGSPNRYEELPKEQNYSMTMKDTPLTNHQFIEFIDEPEILSSTVVASPFSFSEQAKLDCMSSQSKQSHDKFPASLKMSQTFISNGSPLKSDYTLSDSGRRPIRY